MWCKGQKGVSLKAIMSLIKVLIRNLQKQYNNTLYNMQAQKSSLEIKSFAFW